MPRAEPKIVANAVVATKRMTEIKLAILRIKCLGSRLNLFGGGRVDLDCGETVRSKRTTASANGIESSGRQPQERGGARLDCNSAQAASAGCDWNAAGPV